ncbi:MAG: prolipoprotein diacylglyceryl transferase [Oscillospiraceae bacterium]|nr:prolipoprotein diacylglyceryl transferase [Oscillospiraceae bacterium]
MDRIAFIYGEIFIYWSSIVLTLAAACAACLFLAVYLKKGGNGAAGALAVPMSMLLGIVLARLIHWYCRADSYVSLTTALTDYSSGGYALMGVFAGCALTAVLLRLLRVSRSLPEMLDCMCLGGAAGIAVGRLACFFNAADRGQILEGMTELPWVYPVVNTVSGAMEYRLATFVIQAMVTAVIFLGLAIFFLTGREGKRRDGDLTLIFLLCYGASQVVLDSTRYDSLFFRSNGFVSIVQVLGALAIGLACVVFSVRLVKARGFKAWYIALWVLFAALVGGAGYMEYHVQRHGDQAVFAYSVMSGCLVGLIALVLIIRALAVSKEKAWSK